MRLSRPRALLPEEPMCISRYHRSIAIYNYFLANGPIEFLLLTYLGLFLVYRLHSIQTDQQTAQYKSGIFLMAQLHSQTQNTAPWRPSKANLLSTTVGETIHQRISL